MSHKRNNFIAFSLLLSWIIVGCNADQKAQKSEENDNSKSTKSQSEAKHSGSGIGELAIDFELKDLNGNNVKLSELRGKPILLNFWATW